jgi:hypothetical protein
MQIRLSTGFENTKINGMFSITDPLGFAQTVSRIDRNILLKVDDSIPDHIVLRLIRSSAYGNSRPNQIQHQRGSEENL